MAMSFWTKIRSKHLASGAFVWSSIGRFKVDVWVTKKSQSSYWALSEHSKRGALVGGHWKIMVTFSNALLFPFQYVNPNSPLLLFLDHWWGRHTVHDQLCPCSDGEHTSQTHQNTGLLDCTAYWGRLCYTEVSFFFVWYGSIVRQQSLAQIIW